MPSVLPLSFFRRPVLRVAPDLLGKVLVRQRGGEILRAVITEVEAYDGLRDKACHAHRGRTERNAPMFGPGGYWYVYFVYGMHWMLNCVTGEEGYPAAVLIRGVIMLQEENLRHAEWSAATSFDTCLDRLGTTQDDVGGAESKHPSTVLGTSCSGPARLTRAFGIVRRFNGKPASKETGLWIEDRGIVIPRRAIARTPRIGVEYAGEWAGKLLRFVCDTPRVFRGRGRRWRCGGGEDGLTHSSKSN